MERTGKRSWKYELGENDPHIPNKEESKLLRRLMSETGNTEEEIRSIPKYKRMLAEAQRSPEEGGISNFFKDWYKEKVDRYWKLARRITTYPNQHPLTKKEFVGIVSNSGFDRKRILSGFSYTNHDKEYFEENDIDYKRPEYGIL